MRLFVNNVSCIPFGKIALYNSDMKQFIMQCRKFLLLLAIYVDVTTINCHFNPLMDSEYFSIDWAGRESSDDVSNIDNN